MSRSSRQSPFRKTLAALGSPTPPTDSALPPVTAPAATAGTSSISGPASARSSWASASTSTGSASASGEHSRSIGDATMPGVPLSAAPSPSPSSSTSRSHFEMAGRSSDTIPSSATTVPPLRRPTLDTVAPGGPMAFTPLKDDAVRKGKKFFGLHRGLFTAPGRSAAALFRNYYAHGLVIAVLALIVVGGFWGVTELQNYWKSDAYQQKEAREQAVTDGQWDTLIAFARRYGPDSTAETSVRQALEEAYREQVETAVAEAENQLRTGNVDAHRNLQRRLNALATTWAEITNNQAVPDPLKQRIDARVALFDRQALGTVREQIRAAALEAEGLIVAGDVRGGVDKWRHGRDSLRQFASAVNISVSERPAIDDAIRDAETDVLRAVERALSANLRAEADRATVAATTQSTALVEFATARKRLIEEARQIGLGEQALRNLGRDGDGFADDISKALLVRFSDRLEAVGAKATQDLATGPVVAAMQTYRTTAQTLIRDAQTAGLSATALDRLSTIHSMRESDLKLRALRRARDADVDELKALLAVFGDDSAVAEEIGRLITDAYIRQGDFKGAQEFGRGLVKLHGIFGESMNAMWVRRDFPAAQRQFAEFVREADALGEKSAEVSALTLIAQAYRPVIALFAGDPTAYAAERAVVAQAARLVPTPDASLYPMQALSVGYFRLLQGNFAGAAVLIEQAENGLPTGYPLEYLITLARARAGNRAIPDAALQRRPSLNDRDRNKLFLLRYVTSVEQNGAVYDGLALNTVVELITTGQADALIAELNAEAALAVSSDDLMFTLGVIEFFYYYRRGNGLAKMQISTTAAHRQAAALLSRLMDTVYPPNPADADPARISSALDGLRKELPEAESNWAVSLVKALVHFHIGYNVTSIDAGRWPFSQAMQAFESLAEKKPVLRPVCSTYMALISWLQGADARAEQLFRRAIAESGDGFGEAHFWLGSLAQSMGDTTAAVEAFKAAAGTGAVVVPYPHAWYRLAEIAPTIEERQASHQQYVRWTSRADAVSRREFPAPLSAVPGDAPRQDPSGNSPDFPPLDRGDAAEPSEPDQSSPPSPPRSSSGMYRPDTASFADSAERRPSAAVESDAQ